MVELIVVPPIHVDRAWKEGAYRLAESVETSGGEITADQLKMILARGERQLIAMVRDGAPVGWGVIRIDDLPNKRVCMVTDMWAPGAGFAEFLHKLWDWASADGCCEIQCQALEAQARLYKRAGFEPVRTLMRFKK